MKCSIQWGEAELIGTFHLSPHENICSIAWTRKHSIFVLYNLYKDWIFKTKLKERRIEKQLKLKQNIIQAARPTLHGKYYTDASR